MSLIAPLGLLGLIGIIALILIYIIKPNYQQKFVSSTYVWKLSLKYKKKKLPISRLRNIILLICQIIIIVCLALMLAHPFIFNDVASTYNEKIVIIDASANMLGRRNDGETRFEKAVSQVKSLAKNVADANGVITVILADNKPYFVSQREGADLRDETAFKIDELVDPDHDNRIDPYNMKCSYGTGDIDAAMELAEAVLNVNPNAEVLLYTATTYLDKGGVTVVNVSGEEEWNVAALNCVSEVVENFYTFTVDVACYGRDVDLTVYCDVYGVNDLDPKKPVTMFSPVRCEGNNTQQIIFDSDNSGVSIYAFEYAHVYFEMKDGTQVEDSFEYDNYFYLYGGTRDIIRIQYYSTMLNPFISGTLMAYREQFKDKWDIEVVEESRNEPALEGFDFYIFEHEMPETIPTDGVVFLINPYNAPTNSGLVVGSVQRLSQSVNLAIGNPHPVTNGVAVEEVTVSSYRQIISDDGFEKLMYCAGDPVFLVKNEPNVKIAVMSFSLHASNFSVLLDFPRMMRNMFNYFFPSTVSEYVFDVNGSVSVNSRGTSLSVVGKDTVVESFPNEITFSLPGVYSLEQTLLSGKNPLTSIYVKIPAKESNFSREEDGFISPLTGVESLPAGSDLLIYVAAVLVALLFVEWWLQSKEQF